MANDENSATGSAMTPEWQFSFANAIFSAALLGILAAVHWCKMRVFRLNIEKRLDLLSSQFAPVPQALANLSPGFLGEKISDLEVRLDEVDARVRHIEAMIEQSQVPSDGH